MALEPASVSEFAGGNTSSLGDHWICPVQIICNLKIKTILLGMRTSLDQGKKSSLKIVLEQSNTSSPKSSTRVPTKMNDDIDMIFLIVRTLLEQGNTSSLKDHWICPVQKSCNVEVRTILLGMRTSLEQGNMSSLKIVLGQSNKKSQNGSRTK